MKRIINVLFILGGFLSLGSCSNESDNNDIIYLTDAQISSFKLEKNDSITSNLDEVFFSIDQASGEIFNLDSLPYRTKLQKMLANVTFQSASSAKVIAGKDTADYSPTDSIDFSEGQIKMIVTAQDYKTTKEYTIRINVHQQLPDSMVWNRIANNIYNTSIVSQKTIEKDGTLYSFVKTANNISLYTADIVNADTWIKAAETNLPINTNLQSIYTFNNLFVGISQNGLLYKSTNGIDWNDTGYALNNILGILPNNSQVNSLIGYKLSNDDIQIVYTEDLLNWNESNNLIPASNFPIEGYASCISIINSTNYLSIVGGINSNSTKLSSIYLASFNPKNQLDFSMNLNYTGITPIADATCIYYNSQIYLFGGQTEKSFNDIIYTSHNGGVNWAKTDSIVSIPKEFGARADISIIESEKKLWLIGGYDSKAVNTDVWTARINNIK
ncbi:MAG: DUF6242 domain-containing protein [Bacteroidales bacterium]